MWGGYSQVPTTEFVLGIAEGPVISGEATQRSVRFDARCPEEPGGLGNAEHDRLHCLGLCLRLQGFGEPAGGHAASIGGRTEASHWLTHHSRRG
jgi:hypothetical protein